MERPTAAAAKSLQSCPTLCNPIDSSPPGSPVLGFSRQEHWSGLPFPSPMQESEKWKRSHSVVSDPQQPHGLQPSRLLRLLRPWDFPGKSTGVGRDLLACVISLSWKTVIRSVWFIQFFTSLFFLISLAHTTQDQFIFLLALEITPLNILIPYLGNTKLEFICLQLKS